MPGGIFDNLLNVRFVKDPVHNSVGKGYSYLTTAHRYINCRSIGEMGVFDLSELRLEESQNFRPVPG